MAKSATTNKILAKASIVQIAKELIFVNIAPLKKLLCAWKVKRVQIIAKMFGFKV